MNNYGCTNLHCTDCLNLAVYSNDFRECIKCGKPLGVLSPNVQTLIIRFRQTCDALARRIQEDATHNASAERIGEELTQLDNSLAFAKERGK